MVKPDDLTRYADEVTLAYRDLEDSIIRDVSKRLARSGFTDTTVWQLERLQNMAGVSSNVFAEFSKTANVREQVLREAFDDAGGKVVDYKNDLVRRSGTGIYGMTPAMEAEMLAGLTATNARMLNLTGTTATGMSSMYIDLSNRAYMQVASGTMSAEQAIREAVAELAKNGVHTVTYSSSGARRDQVDVAVRRNVLTGVNQAVARMQLAAMEDLGTELVETSAHATARPSHQEWQGQVFYAGGSVGGSVIEGVHYPNFYDATEYGSATGLCGINCRHSFWPFVAGVSTRAYSDRQLSGMRNRTVTVDGEEIDLYDATQDQRAIEREIRATKRELIGLDEVMGQSDDETLDYWKSEFGAVSARLKQQEKELASFADQSGLGIYKDRVAVPGFSRSVSSKAVWAARRSQ